MDKLKIDLQLFGDSIPTSDDIYFRIIQDGVYKKVAVVESYDVSKKKDVKTQDAFGEEEAVATYGSKIGYDLKITWTKLQSGHLKVHL